MAIEETRIRDYIKNYFHQYFDFTLNTDIVTTGFVNLVIPIETLYGETLVNEHFYSHNKTISRDLDINQVLSQYEDTTLTSDLTGYCRRVIDGDTLIIDVPVKKNNNLQFETYRVRLVGVDTPEEGENGHDASKMFLEKVCYTDTFFNYVCDAETTGPYKWDINTTTNKNYNRLIEKNPKDANHPVILENVKKVSIKIDSKKEKDVYGRTLGVLIVDNKNINEVLLKERLAQIMYIPPSEFNPHDWGDVNTPMNVYYKQNDDISILSSYFRQDMKNVVFTPQNDLDTIFRYEIYKNVFFVKLYPYTQHIRMHLFPKSYKCDNQVLFLTDEMTKKRTVKTSGPYKIYEEKDNINAYFQVNGEDRDRETIENKTSVDQNELNAKNFCEFNYDISQSAQSMDNIDIYTGYRYNKTSPYYALHYTGIKDNHLRPAEDRAFLVDVNTDKVKGQNNIISQMDFDKRDPNTLTDDIIDTPSAFGKEIPIRGVYGNDIDHTSEIYKLHHKKVKYIHDTLYSEEDMSRLIPKTNVQYSISTWRDQTIAEDIPSNVTDFTFEIQKLPSQNGITNGVSIKVEGRCPLRTGEEMRLRVSSNNAQENQIWKLEVQEQGYFASSNIHLYDGNTIGYQVWIEYNNQRVSEIQAVSPTLTQFNIERRVVEGKTYAVIRGTSSVPGEKIELKYKSNSVNGTKLITVENDGTFYNNLLLSYNNSGETYKIWFTYKNYQITDIQEVTVE